MTSPRLKGKTAVNLHGTTSSTCSNKQSSTTAAATTTSTSSSASPGRNGMKPSSKNDSDSTPETQTEYDDRGEDQAEKKDDADDLNSPQHEQAAKYSPRTPASRNAASRDSSSGLSSPPAPPFHSSPNAKKPLLRLSPVRTSGRDSQPGDDSDAVRIVPSSLMARGEASSSKNASKPVAVDPGSEGNDDLDFHDSFAGDADRITTDEQRQNDDDGQHSGESGKQEEDAEEKEQEEEPFLWRSRIFVGRMVNHEYVQIAIIVLILLNAIMMGLATMDWVTDNQRIEDTFNKVDRGFLVIFTLECAMQLYYLGVALFQDGWLVFDLAIVILSWSFESLQIVRAFRIFRAFRLITRVKPLRDLVLAVGAVLPRMYAIAALLMIIFYVFAVLFTELFSELPLSENYFRTLDASLFTCMEMMTLEWADIAREVIEYYTWAWAPFTAFIAISGFIVFNLIVAVVVEAVAVTEQTVRALDGIEPNSPAAKLEDAQERIDLIRCHVDDMMKTQEQIQSMLELMAGEMMYLETERMKAEQREALLRNEINRRSEYQKNMESSRQIESLERNYVLEKERREIVRQEREMKRQNSKEAMNTLEGVSLESLKKDEPRTPRPGGKAPRRGSTGGNGNTRSASRLNNVTGSMRSLLTKSISSRSNASSTEEATGKERGWKRFLAFQSNTDK
eukprot:CAMPEP_0178746008 /NCGR_PEP_ID=MMETSP0744-20121128/7590_1 /TAXON_ID=913974 /ORGANISM="Nitzschia punctata, Strain CCMP561" /LENGTH=676 /DNA_ID=CAMNT_0020399211 /DNA_START=402 /DNA_END=2432 /DNA_ORIENTATION=+